MPLHNSPVKNSKAWGGRPDYSIATSLFLVRENFQMNPNLGGKLNRFIRLNSYNHVCFQFSYKTNLLFPVHVTRGSPLDRYQRAQNQALRRDSRKETQIFAFQCGDITLKPPAGARMMLKNDDTLMFSCTSLERMWTLQCVNGKVLGSSHICKPAGDYMYRAPSFMTKF